jgi:hypothetical protein
MRYQGELRFDGSDYDHERDRVRLTGQINRVFECVKDGKWRTLSEISEATGDPHASVSTRLRDFRKSRFGGYKVEKEYIGNGLYKYRLDVNSTQENEEL